MLAWLVNKKVNAWTFIYTLWKSPEPELILYLSIWFFPYPTYFYWCYFPLWFLNEFIRNDDSCRLLFSTHAPSSIWRGAIEFWGLYLEVQSQLLETSGLGDPWYWTEPAYLCLSVRGMTREKRSKNHKALFQFPRNVLSRWLWYYDTNNKSWYLWIKTIDATITRVFESFHF